MKKKTTSTQQNEFKFMAPPRTAEDDRLDAELTKDEQADPSIQYDFARRKASVGNRLGNQFGANYSPETAEAIKYADENDLDQQHGQAMAADNFRRQNARFGKLLSLKQLRDPKLVQTGGTGTQTTNAADFWNGLISGGVSAGLGAI